jgi:two-component system, chemotaxis family, sensor kinase CheA
MNPFESAEGTFREEAAERLSELEAALLQLVSDPTNAELIAQAFRAMHTIKGSCGMFGYDHIASFTHELETAFDEVRSGRLAVTSRLITIGLSAKDVIRRQLAGDDAGARAEEARLMTELRALLPRAGGEDPNDGAAKAPAGSAEKIYRIAFVPTADLFRNGTNPMGILSEISSFGECHVVANTRQVPRLGDMDPEACYTSWDLILRTQKSEDALRDVFLFVEDSSSVHVELLDDGRAETGDEEYKRLGEILVERGNATSGQLKALLQAQKRRIGDLLVQGGVPAEAVEAAAIEQRVVREARGARRELAAQADGGTSIRVRADKLDRLVDLVGELVIAQARLEQLGSVLDSADLQSVAETMARLTGELRDRTLDIRMLPIGTTFGRFKRLVHDLSTELGKEIAFVTEGADTEIDKTVIERLADPLVHLIRNSCDHGVETPEARRAAGKPPRATVRLTAYHTGPHVFVEVRDDGAGLDTTKIRQRAVARGLVGADVKLTDAEIHKLIFVPGFSTADTISSVSGRGVGMDVVKKTLDGLRGAVEIESELGKGTTIRLKLPLTLAIIEGLLVRVGDSVYVLPMAVVLECVELTRATAERSRGSHVVQVRDQLVPYLRLRDWFRADGETPPVEQIVITSADGMQFGFAVDAVIGQHQTVIKGLGRMYDGVVGLSGATILGDGTVALIVDVSALVRSMGVVARASQ